MFQTFPGVYEINNKHTSLCQDNQFVFLMQSMIDSRLIESRDHIELKDKSKMMINNNRI